MTVFKGYMLVLRQNLQYFFLYFGIFLGITLGIGAAMGKSEESMYTPSKLNIAVIDEDDSALSRGIVRALSVGNAVSLDEGDRAELSEKLYYGELDYVVRIPAGATELLLEDEGTLEVTKKPGTYSGYFADSQINSYLSAVRTYASAGYSVEEAAERAAALEEGKRARVTLESRSGHGGEQAIFYWYYRYLPYLYLSTLSYCIGFVLMKFRSQVIRRRMNCSSIPPQRQGIQAAVAFLLIGVGAWGLSVVITLCLYGKSFVTDGNALWYLLNSFTMMLVALSIAFLAGHLVKTDSGVNGISNVISLGMCFLGGVYVDLEILGSRVKSVARFLPVYWYEVNNRLLGEYGELTGERMAELAKGIGLQLIAAGAVLCVTLALRAKKDRGELA